MTASALEGAPLGEHVLGASGNAGEPLMLWPSLTALKYDRTPGAVRGENQLRPEQSMSTQGSGSQSVSSVSRWGHSFNHLSAADESCAESEYPQYVVPLQIKNTFIDTFEGEQSQKLGIKSCPVVKLQKASQRVNAPDTESIWTCAAPSGLGLPVTSAMYGSFPESPTRTASPTSMAFGGAWPSPVLLPQPPNMQMQAYLPPPSQFPPMAIATLYPDQLANSHLTVPPPLPGDPSMAAEAHKGTLNTSALQPQPSAGSLLHGTGRCKPCAWFWKPQGCQNAEKCFHCHLCPEGELKARKKERVAELRAGLSEAHEPSSKNGGNRTSNNAPCIDRPK